MLMPVHVDARRMGQKADVLSADCGEPVRLEDVDPEHDGMGRVECDSRRIGRGAGAAAAGATAAGGVGAGGGVALHPASPSERHAAECGPPEANGGWSLSIENISATGRTRSSCFISLGSDGAHRVGQKRRASSSSASASGIQAGVMAWVKSPGFSAAEDDLAGEHVDQLALGQGAAHDRCRGPFRSARIRRSGPRR